MFDKSVQLVSGLENILNGGSIHKADFECARVTVVGAHIFPFGPDVVSVNTVFS